MPELPEVETIRRQLEPEVTGRRILEADVLDARWTRPEPPDDVERAIAGRTIEAVERRAPRRRAPFRFADRRGALPAGGWAPSPPQVVSAESARDRRHREHLRRRGPASCGAPPALAGGVDEARGL